MNGRDAAADQMSLGTAQRAVKRSCYYLYS